MAACGWCMLPAFGVVGPVRCASSVNGVAPQRQSHGRSACCCIPWWSVPRRSCGVIGVEGSIGRLASSSCATNGWRSRYSLQRPRSPGLPHRFPVLSGPSIVSAGKNGSLAMSLLSPLDRSQSSSLASQNALPPLSVWPAPKMALLMLCLSLGQVCLSGQNLLVSFSHGMRAQQATHSAQEAYQVVSMPLLLSLLVFISPVIHQQADRRYKIG